MDERSISQRIGRFNFGVIEHCGGGEALPPRRFTTRVSVLHADETETMTASTGRVHTHIDGPIGWITFDNPGRHNAMSVAMWEAFPEAVRTLEANTQVRVIVLRGAGDQAFVSGADVSQFDAVRDSLEANQRYEAMGNAGMSRLADCAKPTIAMLHGERGFAIKVAAPKSGLPELIGKIKALGGTDIVVSPIAQIIP